MAIDLLDYFTIMGPRAPIYTHVCGDGRNYHVAVELMRRHTVPGLNISIPAHREAFKHWRQSNTVSLERIAQLAQRPLDLLGPILLCEAPRPYTWELMLPEMDTSACVADGHHRYCLAALRRQREVKAIFYPHHVWSHFVIHGVPDTTAEKLNNEPVTSRSY